VGRQKDRFNTSNGGFKGGLIGVAGDVGGSKKGHQADFSITG
jgi:hypothetical protein